MILLLLCLCFSGMCFSQEFGSAHGNVVEGENEVPAVGVIVRLSNLDTLFYAKTNIDGRYLFAQIPVGEYTIEARQFDVKTQRDLVSVRSQKNSLVADLILKYEHWEPCTGPTWKFSFLELRHPLERNWKEIYWK